MTDISLCFSTGEVTGCQSERASLGEGQGQVRPLEPVYGGDGDWRGGVKVGEESLCPTLEDRSEVQMPGGDLLRALPPFSGSHFCWAFSMTWKRQ